MNGLQKFLRDDRGTATIEFVIWIPIFVALLIIVVDLSMVHLAHTEMWNVARDTARRMTTGVIRTEAEAEIWALGNLNVYDTNYSVAATRLPDSYMLVVVSAQFSDISVFGFAFESLLGNTIRASVVMRAETS